MGRESLESSGSSSQASTPAAPPPARSVNLPDHENPVNFSAFRKAHIIVAGAWFTANSATGSALPSGAVDYIREDFSVTDDTHLVLLNSLFLVGYSLGPLFWGPMSEYVGRSRVLLAGYVSFALFTMACALSPNFEALLVFRLLCGVFAACPNAVVGGLYADIYDEPVRRGRMLAYFMAATTLGPPLGPIISGFASLVNWRLTFWIGLALIGVGLPVVILMPETYAPIVRRRLRRKEAKKLAVEGSDEAQYTADMAPLSRTETLSGQRDMKVIFTRPLVMFCKEPVVLFCSLYLALVYSVLYLFFQAYPIIFGGVYGMSPGFVGLAFIPVMGGSVAALVIFMAWSSYHDKALKAGAPWALQEEYRRLPLACFGGPILAISLFWLGWSAHPSVHPSGPMMSGLLFGCGYLLIFMAILNYVTDAYRQFSASAQSAASTTRSVCAVCLPLATRPMYDALGVAWACSLLGFVALAMAAIPFVFIKYGRSIRARSPFAQQLLAATAPVPQERVEEEEAEEELARRSTLNA